MLLLFAGWASHGASLGLAPVALLVLSLRPTSGKLVFILLDKKPVGVRKEQGLSLLGGLPFPSKKFPQCLAFCITLPYPVPVTCLLSHFCVLAWIVSLWATYTTPVAAQGGHALLDIPTPCGSSLQIQVSFEF